MRGAEFEDNDTNGNKIYESVINRLQMIFMGMQCIGLLFRPEGNI